MTDGDGTDGIAMADVWVDVTGMFDPEQLTATTGIQPSSTRRRGTATYNPQRVATKDRWSLRFPVNSHDFGEAVMAAIQQLESIEDVITPMIKNGVRVTLVLEAYVVGSPDSVIPAADMDSATIRKLAALGVGVVFDISLLEPDPTDLPPGTMQR